MGSRVPATLRPVIVDIMPFCRSTGRSVARVGFERGEFDRSDREEGLVEGLFAKDRESVNFENMKSVTCSIPVAGMFWNDAMR